MIVETSEKLHSAVDQRGAANVSICWTTPEQHQNKSITSTIEFGSSWICSRPTAALLPLTPPFHLQFLLTRQALCDYGLKGNSALGYK